MAIIDGKKIAEEMLAEVAEEVKKLPKRPRLAAILVGDHANNRKFLELKKKAAEKVGIDFGFYDFPGEITTQKFRKEVVRISKAVVNDGVIIELPLPEHLNVQYLLNAIPPEKDVDVLSERAQGAFFAGRSSVLPPAVEAIKQILEKHNITRPVRDGPPQGDHGHAFGGAVSNGLKGKNCAIFGYGLLVGRQVAHWLASGGATASVINEHTPDPAYFSSTADIIVSGVGKPGIIKADMVKEGAIVIDFGIGSGDVDFENVSKKAGLITPVPGGVGPIVVAAVLKNSVTLLHAIDW